MEYKAKSIKLDRRKNLIMRVNSITVLAGIRIARQNQNFTLGKDSNLHGIILAVKGFLAGLIEEH